MTSFLLTSATIGSWMDKTFLSFDLGVFSFFGRMGCGFLNAVARIFTAMGETKYVIMLAVLGLVFIFFKKTRKYGMALVFAIIIGTLITNIIIKPMFLRIRPYNTLQYIPEYFGWYVNAGTLAESDYCFPSGHTTAAFEIAISMCLCFSSDGKKKIAWIFPVLALLTGFSRIYLMVHYATDIIAGIIIGTIAGLVGYLIARLITQKLSGGYGWNKYDLGRVIEEKRGRTITRRTAGTLIAIAWAVIFIISLVFVFRAGGDSLRCAYDEDYRCYNEVKQQDKYLIDGEYYCKIHTAELTSTN